MNNFRRRVGSSGNKKEIEIDPVTGRGLIDGYEVVDLGLPSGTLWATCNVGATYEYQYGNYYGWGGLEPYGGIGGAPRYYTPPVVYDGYTLPPEYDVVTQTMGSDWRMPTKDEVQELIDNTKTMQVYQSLKMISKTNPEAYMSLPTSGYYNSTGANYGDLVEQGNLCAFWTSTLSRHTNVAYRLLAYTDGTVYGEQQRSASISMYATITAMPVRGIYAPSQ